MTPEREDWLTTQYVWAIENERGWSDEVALSVQTDNFGGFRRRTANYINTIHKLVANDHDCNKPKEIEWAFIVLTLWLNKGGSKYAVLVDPGVLKPHYAALLDGLHNKRRGPHEPHETEATEAVPNETETQEEITMNQAATVAFVTKSYIYGKDVEQMSEAELIDAIRSVEAQIASLKMVQTPSKKIAAKIAELEDMLKKIVATLDGE